LVHISADPFFQNYPVRGFEMDLAIAGSSSLALAMLEDELAGAPGDDARIASRREAIAELARARALRQQAAVQAAADRTPISPAWVAHCVNQIRTDSTVVVNEMGVPLSFLDLTQPRSYLS